MSLLSTGNDVITLSQFCEEADLFSMSKEYYSLVQESYEMDLMSRHLQCQLLIEESGATDVTNLGLITESADNIDVITESFGEKAKGFFKKLWTGFLKAMKAVGTFFVRLARSWSNGKRVEELEAKVQELENLNAEEKQRAVKYLNDITELRQEVNAKNREIGEKNKKLGDAWVKNNQLVQEANTMRILWENMRTKFDKMNAQFKGVDADLYKRLKRVSASIAEEVHVISPAIVGEIGSLSEEIVKVMDIFEVSYKGVKVTGNEEWAQGNNGAWKNRKKYLADVKERCQNLKVNRTELTITAAKVEKTAKDLQESSDRAHKLNVDIQGRYFDTTGRSLTGGNGGGSNNKYSSDNPVKFGKDIKTENDKLRTQSVIEAGGAMSAMHGILSEYVELSSNCIKALKDFLDERNANIATQEKIIKAIASAKTA